MIRRVLPYPILSLALLLLWLLLNQSLSPAHFVLGTCLGIGGGLILTALEPSPMQFRHPAALAVLGWLVLLDIVRSNIAVARIILGTRLPTVTSGFVEIPLELRAPHGLAALAIIITATPGTIWVNHDSVTGVLTIHVLDLVDESAWLRTIKGRYERRLMEIFE
ncbi:MAG TPA: Na+/H+ antiporter subunit E [Dongiaceae bacterium]